MRSEGIVINCVQGIQKILLVKCESNLLVILIANNMMLICFAFFNKYALRNSFFYFEPDKPIYFISK